MSRLHIPILFLLLGATASPLVGQCQPEIIGPGHSATATRLVVAGNSAQRPQSEISSAMTFAMNLWNQSPCQAAGITFPWFQQQASGAEDRVNVFFDAGMSQVITSNGTTACGRYIDERIPREIHLYAQFKDADGNEWDCGSLGTIIGHEMGHYLGLGHTSQSAACGSHIMSPEISGNEWVHPVECEVADQNSETGYEAGEVGCTDDDWCDPDHCSPILIDFGGDLFQLTGAEDPVWFDIDGTGRRRAIGWTREGTDDGFLCRDLDGNGRIDHGGELFGTATRLSNGELAKSGYEAMGELDLRSHGGNEDGVLSREDRGFWGLCVWRDTDRSGTSEQGELTPLARSGLLSLDITNHRAPHLDPHRNVLMYHSGAQLLRDGHQLYVRTVDVFFEASTDRTLRP